MLTMNRREPDWRSSWRAWHLIEIVGLIVVLAAQAGFAEEAGTKATEELQARISVVRLGSDRSTPDAGSTESSQTNHGEARVGDRIRIELYVEQNPTDSQSSTKENRFKDQKVIVTFANRNIPHEVTWAKWDKGIHDDEAPDYTKLLVSVPQRVLVDPDKPEWVSVEVQVGKYLLTGHAGLHVYPKTKVVLETINGRGADSDPPAAIEWNQQVRVTGSGFVAPGRRIELSIAGVNFPVQDVDPDGRSFVARVSRLANETKDKKKEKDTEKERDADKASVHLGRQSLELKVWDSEVDLGGFNTVQVDDEQELKGRQMFSAASVALLPLALLAVVLGVACRKVQNDRHDVDPKSSKPGTFFGSFDLLLLDPVTKTYSLSRFQFIWWLGIVLFSYGYLFFARGLFVAGDWCFYDLSGSAYPLLISLGTLVGASFTAKIVGPKGAGEHHPAITDYFVHGGVVSLDRVQQLAISVIAGIMFVVIALQTSPTTATLPDVPERLLTLMGFSSAGYLAGKFARVAGPIVQDVDVVWWSASAQKGKGGIAGAGDADKVRVLRIRGFNLSVDARVLVNENRVDPDHVKPGEAADRSPDFAKELRIEVEGLTPGKKCDLESIVVTNRDLQDAKWLPSKDQKKSITFTEQKVATPVGAPAAA